ncbi:MAG: VWA domain-containing protein [Pseudomonadota bacterium]
MIIQTYTYRFMIGLLAACCWLPATAAQRPDLDVSLSTPVMPANQKQTAFLKVALTGFELPNKTSRPPLNVAIVLDKSGSMSGDKIHHAREAAIMAVSMLGPNDIASVVTYDDVVRVVAPATKVTDKHAITQAIRNIPAGGSTALFAGVSKGAQEVRKFFDQTRVNRVILLSDGRANVGPSSPTELGQLGGSLGSEGISVTTIGLGLGYNEDLMTQLAGYSDGNHAFAENAYALGDIFQSEFGSALSVVAQDVEIDIHCAEGIRPLRVLGREAEILGQRVRVNMNQLAGLQEKFIMLEVETTPGQAGQKRDVASVDVSYLNMLNKKREQQQQRIDVAFSESKEEVKKAVDNRVMSSATAQIANIMSKEAVQLRDEGKTEQAGEKLKEAGRLLRQNAEEYAAPELEVMADQTEADADSIAKDEEWNAKRKSMRERQYKQDNQQDY